MKNYILSIVIKLLVLEQLNDGANDSVKAKKNLKTKYDLIDLLLKQVRLIIEDNLCVTVEEVQNQTGLSYSATHRIISDYLQLTKITAR